MVIKEIVFRLCVELLSLNISYILQFVFGKQFL